MKSKENLIFLGMMGSGKSSIGSLVAKKLQLNFIDIDNEIETELGLSIKKIFEAKGENYFRKFEEKITLKKLKLNPVVISLGGGAFTNRNIRKEVIKNHLSFWLNWSYQVLIDRINKSEKRPLAIQATNNELIDLIKKRSNIYSKALKRLAAKPLTSPVIPPPIDIKQSFLEKLFSNRIFKILFTLFIFLLISFALKKWTLTSLFFKDFFILKTIFFGIF